MYFQLSIYAPPIFKLYAPSIPFPMYSLKYLLCFYFSVFYSDVLNFFLLPPLLFHPLFFLLDVSLKFAPNVYPFFQKSKKLFFNFSLTGFCGDSISIKLKTYFIFSKCTKPLQLSVEVLHLCKMENKR